MSAESPLLAIAGLGVSFAGAIPKVEAVADVALTLERGGSLGLVGESGAGKSQLALAIPGLSAPGASLLGSIRFAGEELIGAPAARLRALRGRHIGFIAQDPQAALAPHLRIGTQLTETVRAHRALDAGSARSLALAMLERVQVPAPALRLGQYPHELSGGLRQRVLIAIALIAGPELLIADEPTTALDVTVEAEILALFLKLRHELSLTLVLVSHDLAVVGGLCDEIAVMYAGRVVESGPAMAVLAAPRHHYTAALAAASATLEAPLGIALATIAGAQPAPGVSHAGCAFAPRCPAAADRCRAERPPLVPVAGGSARVACHFPRVPG